MTGVFYSYLSVSGTLEVEQSKETASCASDEESIALVSSKYPDGVCLRRIHLLWYLQKNPSTGYMLEATLMTVSIVLRFLCIAFICLLPLVWLDYKLLEQTVSFWSYDKHGKVLV